MIDDQEYLARARRDGQKIVDALHQRGYYLLRNDLVKRWTDGVLAGEWIDSMSPDVRVLFEAVDATVEYFPLWMEARRILLEEQREAAQGNGDNR